MKLTEGLGNSGGIQLFRVAVDSHTQTIRPQPKNNIIIYSDAKEIGAGQKPIIQSLVTTAQGPKKNIIIFSEPKEIGAGQKPIIQSLVTTRALKEYHYFR